MGRDMINPRLSCVTDCLSEVSLECAVPNKPTQKMQEACEKECGQSFPGVIIFGPGIEPKNISPGLLVNLNNAYWDGTVSAINRSLGYPDGTSINRGGPNRCDELLKSEPMAANEPVASDRESSSSSEPKNSTKDFLAENWKGFAAAGGLVATAWVFWGVSAILVADDITGVGFADDPALAVTVPVASTATTGAITTITALAAGLLLTIGLFGNEGKMI